MVEIVPRIMRIMAGQLRHVDAETTDTQVAVLYILSDRALSLTSLAEYMSVSTAAMTKTVTTMESRGWVTRTRSEVDRRLVSIAITPEGAAARQHIEDEVAARLAALLATLDSDQQAQIAQAFRHFRDLFIALEAGARPTI